MPQHFETMQCAICRVRVCMWFSALSFIWDVSECSWRRRLRLFTHQRSNISSFTSVGLVWSRFSDVWRFRVCCCCLNRGRPGPVLAIFLVFSVWFVGLGESVETQLPCTERVLNKVQISGCWPLLSLVWFKYCSFVTKLGILFDSTGKYPELCQLSTKLFKILLKLDQVQNSQCWSTGGPVRAYWNTSEMTKSSFCHSNIWTTDSEIITCSACVFSLRHRQTYDIWCETLWDCCREKHCNASQK